MVPVVPIITGVTFVFTFHMRCIYIIRSLHYYYYYYYYCYYYYCILHSFQQIHPSFFLVARPSGCEVASGCDRNRVEPAATNVAMQLQR
jgi:hypothetical protein